MPTILVPKVPSSETYTTRREAGQLKAFVRMMKMDRSGKIRSGRDTRKQVTERGPAPSSPERFRKGPLADMPEEMRANALLTTKEVAALLGVSPHTVTRWRWEGSATEDGDDHLKFLRLRNNSIRYRASELRAWLDRREVQTTAEERQVRPQGLQGVVGWSAREE